MLAIIKMRNRIMKKYGKDSGKYKLYTEVCFENGVSHFQLYNLYHLLMTDED